MYLTIQEKVLQASQCQARMMIHVLLNLQNSSSVYIQQLCIPDRCSMHPEKIYWLMMQGV